MLWTSSACTQELTCECKVLFFAVIYLVYQNVINATTYPLSILSFNGKAFLVTKTLAAISALNTPFFSFKNCLTLCADYDPL